MKNIRSLLFFCAGLHLRCCFSSSKSSNSTSSTTNAYDYRKAVGDSGILAESGSSVDDSVTQIDARDLSDRSTFAIDASDNSTTIDARDLSDRSVAIDSRDLSDNSSFSIATQSTDARQTSMTDARDFSDRSSFSTSSNYSDSSTTTINAADAEVLKATASGAFSAANLITAGSQALFEDAIRFGDAAVARSVAAQVGAVEQLGETTKSAVQLAQQAAGIVAASNSTASTSTNVEKAIKAGMWVAIALVLAFIFRGAGRSRA